MNKSEFYLNALIQGDNKVILSIYNSFYPKIETYILSKGGKKEDIQDIFHDALIYLIVKHSEKPLEINSFGAYLFTICTNIWKTGLKNKKLINDNIIVLTDKETDLSLLIIEQKRMDFYREKFQLLSENCIEILGNYFNGMSYQDILEDLSYSSINSIRQRVFKCRKKLITLIKSDARYHKLKK